MDKTKLLVVVDMQNDFINGPLGSCAAREIVEKVCEKIDSWDGYVLYTYDTHYEDYLETTEGKYIPVEHCINKTSGWELTPEIAERFNKDSFRVYKNTFGSADLANIISYLEVKSVQFVGVCTDICVVSNAIMARSIVPDVQISVDASCCAGTSPENHRAALRVMHKCCIDILNDDSYDN